MLYSDDYNLSDIYDMIFSLRNEFIKSFLFKKWFSYVKTVITLRKARDRIY